MTSLMTPSSVQIPLSGKNGAGRFCLVSAQDAEWIAARKPNLVIPKIPPRADGTTVDGRVIVMVLTETRRRSLAHVILDVPLRTLVTHINGDRLDNRRENIKVHVAKSGPKGVAVINMRGVSRAELTLGDGSEVVRYYAHNGNGLHNGTIGVFETAQEAGAAYDEWAKKVIGKKARLNFARDT